MQKLPPVKPPLLLPIILRPQLLLLMKVSTLNIQMREMPIFCISCQLEYLAQRFTKNMLMCPYKEQSRVNNTPDPPTCSSSSLCIQQATCYRRPTHSLAASACAIHKNYQEYIHERKRRILKICI